eukprot:scaffold26521_cov23-Tisochrysis_lutea.AAC.2
MLLPAVPPSSWSAHRGKQAQERRVLGCGPGCVATTEPTDDTQQPEHEGQKQFRLTAEQPSASTKGRETPQTKALLIPGAPRAKVPRIPDSSTEGTAFPAPL